MDVRFATAATPGRRNEDLVIATDEFVIVLDGVTSPPHVPTGCVHDPVWLVRTLGSILATALTCHPQETLTALLANAIADLRSTHSGSCDLSHPESPSSTVAVVRERHDIVDYLVLCDSTVVLTNHDGGVIRIVTDDRTAHLHGLTRAAVAELRNVPGGFWVASTDPAAAAQALTGSLERSLIGTALVCTDGATRLVDRFGRTWPEMLRLVETGSVRDLLHAVRVAELAGGPASSGKQHDDATMAVCSFAQPWSAAR